MARVLADQNDLDVSVFRHVVDLVLPCWARLLRLTDQKVDDACHHKDAGRYS